MEVVHKNLDDVTIEFKGALTALVGLNNYGKSNLLSAIEFGLALLKASPAKRAEMMSSDSTSRLS